MKNCSYCKKPLTGLHHNARHCLSKRCIIAYETDRAERVRETSRQWNKNRNIEYGPYKCRYCDKKLPLNGPRMFCDDYCMRAYAGSARIDGDYLFG